MPEPDLNAPQVSQDETSQRTPWLRWLGTTASLALFIYLLFNLGWQELIEALQQISIEFLLLSCLFALLSRLSVCARWYALLRSAEVNISFKQTVQLVFAGLFASNFLPTTIGGDVVRFAGAVRLNLDAAVCAASLVVDRLVGMAGMLTVSPFGLFQLFASTAGPQSREILQGIALGPIWQKLFQKGKHAFQSVWGAVQLWWRHPKGLGAAYLCTWGHMISTFVIAWLLLLGMGQQISFWTVAGLWSLSYFITLIPVSVNGLGLQELSLTYLFTQYGHASMQSVLAMAVLTRALYTFVSLPGAIFVPGLIQPKKSKTK
jgi:uncharacterized membrane protein YbhN (UPF0104 family)